jgi:hypothetical protein
VACIYNTDEPEVASGFDISSLKFGGEQSPGWKTLSGVNREVHATSWRDWQVKIPRAIHPWTATKVIRIHSCCIKGEGCGWALHMGCSHTFFSAICIATFVIFRLKLTGRNSGLLSERCLCNYEFHAERDGNLKSFRDRVIRRSDRVF